MTFTLKATLTAIIYVLLVANSGSLEDLRRGDYITFLISAVWLGLLTFATSQVWAQ